jgi:hypothetical protein
MNYLGLGFFVPSFVPIGITLPGRVMENLKIKSAANESTPSSPRLFSKCKRNALLATLAASVTATSVLAYQQYKSS